jgi:hypothetical protein
MRRVLAAVAFLAAAAPAAAAVFAATTVEGMTRRSDAVVRGRVLATAARPTRDGRIVTEVEVAVDQAWKGEPGGTVRIVVPGGRLPNVAMRVDAAPTFAPGEEVVVFLSRGGPVWHVSGLALGKFRVERDAARPSLEGADVVPPASPLPEGEREVGPMPVAELERRVRAAR